MASEIWEDSEATFYFYNLIYIQIPIAQKHSVLIGPLRIKSMQEYYNKF